MSGRYGNIKKRVVDGITFASGAEANRYLVLKDMERRGEIQHLEVHPHFDFVVGGCKVARGYTADFAYIAGRTTRYKVVEDVKGPVERDWPLRRDLFLALNPDCVLLVNGKEVKRKLAPPPAAPKRCQCVRVRHGGNEVIDMTACDLHGGKMKLGVIR
jgi:hypothetical protein